MSGIKLFFKYFIYYFVWYFTLGNKSDSYYYDNELYIDIEKEFKRDLRFRDIERFIIVVGSQFLIFSIRLIFFNNDGKTNAMYFVLIVALVFVFVSLITVIVFSLWSTCLKIKELKSQS